MIAFAGAALVAGANAQPPAGAKDAPPAIEKPKAPAKPVVPVPRASEPKAAPGKGAPFAPDLQAMSAEARAFATSRLSAMTPALRVSAASRLVGKAVAPADIPTTWIATAANPSTPSLWLGGKGINLVTGPDLEPMFQLGAGEPGERGVWVQFNAEAGLRYMLVCDMTGPSRWDVIADSRARSPVIEDRPTRGLALIPALPARGYRRVLLTVARPLETGPGSSVMDVLRRCEVTAILA